MAHVFLCKLIENINYLKLIIMKQTFLSIILMLLPMMASADDSGTCGDNVTWKWVESTKTLTISGTGYIDTYGYFPWDDVGSFSDTPWTNYKEKIQTVIIKQGVNGIGGGAFHDCINLTSVIVPSSVTKFGPCAFSGCSSLSSINIPNGVQSILYNAFQGCNSLSSITIPSSVTYIELSDKYFNAFTDCGGLTSIIVESGNPNYDSRNNCNAIIETSTNTLIAGSNNTIIPNTVSSIAHHAFSGRSNMTSITIPNSVTAIRRDAFSGCTKLSTITIPNTVTEMGDGIFSGCTDLTSVTIEGDRFSLESSVFSGCSKLTDIYFTGLVDNTFSISRPYYYGDGFYSNVTAHVPAAFLEKYPNVFFEYGNSNFGFKDLKTLEGSSIPKCEKPDISYVSGKLSFSCATPGVEYHWTITSANGEEGSGVSQEVTPSFTVNVYAAKTGCINSDMVTRQFDCNTGGLKGDVDGNGVVNVADHVKLSEIIMKQ